MRRAAAAGSAAVCTACVPMLIAAAAAEPTRVDVFPADVRQVFDGLGCRAIFYEAHITSFAARGRHERQEKLYDDLFDAVPTRYLHLWIRPDHEPRNDNDDPWTPAFRDADFAYCDPNLAIVAAARKRRPDMELYASLYTPLPWMKTNGAESGGGWQRATLRRGHELELGEYAWAFLERMHRGGATIGYLSICNEPDWPHSQPGPAFARSAPARWRTSAADDAAELPALAPAAGRVEETLPPRALVTYVWQR
jgi:O-glycosyl hydrolase